MATKNDNERDTSAVPEATESSPTSGRALDPFTHWGLPAFENLWPRLFPAGRPMALFGDEPIRVEQFRDDGDFVIRAELPGIDPEKEIEVAVERGMLHISATRERKSETSEEGSYRSEFSYGTFRRSVALPEGADAEAVSATYDDGILEIRTPLTEPTTSTRTIPIKR